MGRTHERIARGRALRSNARLLFLLPVLWLTFVLLLGLSALIPRSAIAENMEKTAAYYADKPIFQLPKSGDHSSLIHNYADAMLFNLVWNTDSAAPFSSPLDARYHQNAEFDPCVALGETVLGGAPPETSYARYWHGATALLRPLLVVTDVGGIRMISAVAFAALTLTVFVLLLRRRLWALALGMTMGLVLCKAWVVPQCLEYLPPFLLMLGFCSFLLLRKNQTPPYEIFLAMGALVCFFDFLTCEIITLFVPLIFLLFLRCAGEKNAFRPALKLAAQCGGLWLCGYALTFLCKWVLAAALFDRSLGEVALTQGAERAVGNIVTVVGGQVVAQKGLPPANAVLVNLGRMFPMSMGRSAWFISLTFLGVCLALFCLWFLLRKRRSDRGVAGVILLLALAPFLRYMVLFNHALLHPFMTYRDLLISVLAVTAALALTIQSPKMGKKRRKP